MSGANFNKWLQFFNPVVLTNLRFNCYTCLCCIPISNLTLAYSDVRIF